MSFRSVVRISLSALDHNFQQVRQHIKPSQQILAMVKANAYGHGSVSIAKALTDADAFGVATTEEALELREANITKPIVVLSGFFSSNELSLHVEHELTGVVHHSDQINLLEKTTLKKPLSIWFKLDTGMHRLGFLPEDFSSAYQRLEALSSVCKPIVLMTHLADADNRDTEFTKNQLALFEKITSGFENPKSIGNSAAILSGVPVGDFVRPGLMLYGASPFSDQIGKDLGLKPVMTFESRIISVKGIRRGERVGYNGTWIAPTDVHIAVVGVGYGDGYPRCVNQAEVLIRGQKCPVVGRISMDSLTVDVTHLSECQLGDVVTLWGDDLPIEHLSTAAETISYELFCRPTRRVEFILEE